MLLGYIIFVYTITSVTSASTSYQYIRFPRPSESRPSKSAFSSIKPNSGRPSRSFHHPLNIFEENGNFLHDGIFFPPLSDIDLSFSPEELTQFSHDLTDHHDPLLLTGNSALAAVRYIYGKGELFFGDYPHVNALLKNQDKRMKNGLAGHKLGSIRTNSPFQRYPLPIKYSQYI